MVELKEIDRRWVFLCVALALALTVLFPFSQPITPSPSVRGVYDHIEGLPEGSTVLLAIDYDPQAKAELEPMTEAVVKHCFRRGVRVIGVAFWPQGATLGKAIIDRNAKRLGKVSGTDYVYLGYKPGGYMMVITNMGENFNSAFNEDANGEPTSGMPIFRDVKNLRDLSYVIDFAAGDSTDSWVIYGGDKYQVPLAAGCTAVVAPDLYVYLNSGQLNGIIAGLRGAADYEVLLGSPGAGIAGMPAQSVVHAIIILLVISSNVLYFWGRRTDKRRQELSS